MNLDDAILYIDKVRHKWPKSGELMNSTPIEIIHLAFLNCALFSLKNKIN